MSTVGTQPFILSQIEESEWKQERDPQNNFCKRHKILHYLPSYLPHVVMHSRFINRDVLCKLSSALPSEHLRPGLNTEEKKKVNG